jgi:tetratricopeptide (TPR) repeat protein
MQNKTIIALLIGLFAAAALGGAVVLLQPFQMPGQPSAAADEQETQTQIAAYESLIAENPEDPKYHQGLGNLYWSLGEWEKAAEHFQQALELVPEDNELRVTTAMANWHAGQTEEAVRHLRTVVQRDPEDVMAQFYLGMLLANMEGQEDEAIAALQRTLTLAGEGEVADQARQMLAELGVESEVPSGPSPEASGAKIAEPASEDVTIFPQLLGGLKLQAAYAGGRAKREIEQMHGGKIRIDRGYVAHYVDGGRTATFWVSETAGEEEAAALLTQMQEGIAKGGTPFSALELVAVPGLEAIPVYATQGMGQFHYIWVKKRLIVWVALDEPDLQQRLEFLKAALVFIGYAG